MDDKYDNRKKELKILSNDKDCTLSEFIIKIELNENVYEVVPVYFECNCGNKHWLSDKDGKLYGWSPDDWLDKQYKAIIWEKEEGKVRETFRGWWKSQEKYSSSKITVSNFNYYYD